MLCVMCSDAVLLLLYSDLRQLYVPDNIPLDVVSSFVYVALSSITLIRKRLASSLTRFELLLLLGPQLVGLLTLACCSSSQATQYYCYLTRTST